MKFNELKVESNRDRRRVGRGISAGQGKTAGRGTKGQNARTGNKKKPGFEGGSNPIMQKVPKLRGFTSHRAKVETVYTGQLDQFSGGVADNFTVANAGLTSSPYVRVKLVVKGDVTKKVDVKLQSASNGATEAVQKAGGSFAAVPQVGRTAAEKEETKK